MFDVWVLLANAEREKLMSAVSTDENMSIPFVFFKFSVMEDRLETISSIRHLAYPPNRAWITTRSCFIFLFYILLMWNFFFFWMHLFLFFIPNSHGFMGKERVTKLKIEEKKAPNHDCTTFVDPGFPWQDPAFLILYFKRAYYFNCSCLMC